MPKTPVRKTEGRPLASGLKEGEEHGQNGERCQEFGLLPYIL